MFLTFSGALLQGKPMIDSSDTQMDDDSKIQQTSNSNHPKQLSELGVKFFQIEVCHKYQFCLIALQYLFLKITVKDNR